LNILIKSCTIFIETLCPFFEPSWEASMEMIKVSANSRTSAVAGAIAGVIREHRYAEVQAIGAGAVNQAVKALVLATGYLRNDGIDVCCVPEFVDVEIEDKVRTAIRLVVEPRIPETPPLASTEPEAVASETIEPEPTEPDIS
jgi:stage V sporulation protein S